jgi:hypothetical protein
METKKDQKKVKLIKEEVLKPEAEENTPETLPEIYIDLATSEEDVVAYDQAGANLIFLKKRFRRISKENLDALSKINRDSYLKTLREMRLDEEALRPPPRPKIIDPLGGHEGALLNVKVTDPKWEKTWHVCWKHTVEQDALARVGYIPVRAGEDPIECGLKPAGTTFVLPDPRKREDLDLILMKVRMTTFLQHQTAVAAESTARIKGYVDKFRGDVEEASKGKLKGAVIEEETEAVQLKRSDLTPA